MLSSAFNNFLLIFGWDKEFALDISTNVRIDLPPILNIFETSFFIKASTTDFVSKNSFIVGIKGNNLYSNSLTSNK